MGASALVCVCLLGVVLGAGAGASRVPVLMWGSAVVGGGARPLQHTSGEQWERAAATETAGHDLTVVFVEETLSAEDLSGRDAEGRVAFPQVRTRIDSGRLVHLPAVPSPLTALRHLAHPDHLNRVRLTDEGLSADIHSATGKFLFIELEDAKEGEDRFRMLARHDAFMNQMFDKLLEKHPSVLAIYTAHYPSWEIPTERVRRETSRHLMEVDEPSTVSGFYNSSDKVYLYAPMIKLVTESKDVNITNGEPTLTEYSGGYNLTFPLKEDEENIVFVVEGRQGYWWMDKVVYIQKDGNEEVLTASDVYAPIGFSYSCHQTTVYRYNKTSVSLKSLQIQPFFNASTNGRFSSSYDCVGTMTVPIWSGLFIVFLLLIIIIGGVIMMMDIKTMDRFDDPKGKTITINAAE